MRELLLAGSSSNALHSSVCGEDSCWLREVADSGALWAR